MGIRTSFSYPYDRIKVLREDKKITKSEGLRMGKITMSLAMSVDGYIAETDGGYAWIKGNIGEMKKLHVGETYVDYGTQIRNYKSIVMGSKSFDLGMHHQFDSHDVIVITRTPEKYAPENGVTFMTPEAAIKAAEEIKASDEKLMIFGGGQTVSLFMEEDLIDEYEIGIIPVMLGDGVKLFHRIGRKIPLRLKTIFQENEIVVLRYSRE